MSHSASLPPPPPPPPNYDQNMMTSSNGNIFRVTGPLWGEFTGHRWIPLTKASDTELSYLFWSAPEQTIETPVIQDAMGLIMTSLQWNHANPLRVSRIKTIGTEMYKYKNDINPAFVGDLLTSNDLPYSLRNCEKLDQPIVNKKNTLLELSPYHLGANEWKRSAGNGLHHHVGSKLYFM